VAFLKPVEERLFRAAYKRSTIPGFSPWDPPALKGKSDGPANAAMNGRSSTGTPNAARRNHSSERAARDTPTLLDREASGGAKA